MQSTTNASKTASKRATQNTAEAMGDLTVNKITDKITSVSKIPPRNNSETNEERILGEKHKPSELTQKIIDLILT